MSPIVLQRYFSFFFFFNMLPEYMGTPVTDLKWRSILPKWNISLLPSLFVSKQRHSFSTGISTFERLFILHWRRDLSKTVY